MSKIDEIIDLEEFIPKGEDVTDLSNLEEMLLYLFAPLLFEECDSTILTLMDNKFVKFMNKVPKSIILDYTEPSYDLKNNRITVSLLKPYTNEWYLLSIEFQSDLD